MTDTCRNCKWLENNGTWCDMKRSGVDKHHEKCKYYDNSIRRFEPQTFYNMCKQYVEMYDSFSKYYSSVFNEDNRLFDYGEVELLGYVLNDIQREIQYYHRANLDEDLNKIKPPITQRD